MNVIIIVLDFIGALGMFLYGMKVMSEGLQKSAGNRLQAIMNHLTSNRYMGVFTGFITTILLQSSSATTVMVVGFVNAGILNLVQSIGIIMGANIGTTVTSWIVSLFGFKFKIASFVLPIIAVGFPLYFSKGQKQKFWGEFLIGFGLLFLGIEFLKNSIPKPNAETLTFLAQYANHGYLSILLFVFIGLILTVVVHSSSASTTIILTMAHTGLLSFPISVAMIFGSNIGTTIDALLASLGGSTNAKRAAFVHLLFNLIGSLLAVIFFYPFVSLINVISPTEDITIKLALVHTLFNVCNTLVFLPFTTVLANFVTHLIKEKEEDTSGEYSLPFLLPANKERPTTVILNVRQEISQMTSVLQKMFLHVINVLQNPDQDMSAVVKKIYQEEELTDRMQEEMLGYIGDSFQLNLSEHQATTLQAYSRIINELEHLGDCCMNIVLWAKRRYERKIPLYENAEDDLIPYSRMVQEFFDFVVVHTQREEMAPSDIKKAYEYEEKINLGRNRLKKIARTSIIAGGNVKGGLLFIDIVRQLENMGDYCLNVAQTLQENT